MANTLAHLIISNEILKRIPNLIEDKSAYFIGSVSVDCNTATRDDKRMAHLRSEIRDFEWRLPSNMDLFEYRLSNFIYKNILNVSGYQRDFNIGYVIHLLVDQCNYRTLRQTMIQRMSKDNYLETDRIFFHLITNDLECLDNYLNNIYSSSEDLKNYLFTYNGKYELSGMVSCDQINNSVDFWKNIYFPNIKTRETKYLNTNDIDAFIIYSIEFVIKRLNELKIIDNNY